MQHRWPPAGHPLWPAGIDAGPADRRGGEGRCRSYVSWRLH